MVPLAGLCVAHSSAHLCLISPSDGSIQSSADQILENTPHSLSTSLSALAHQRPRELTVLTLSTQVPSDQKEDISETAEGAGIYVRSTVNHVDAYIASIKVEELHSGIRILFLEVLPSIAVAQLVEISLDQGQRTSQTIRTTSISPRTHDTIRRLVEWSVTPDQPLTQLVVLDQSVDMGDPAVQAALSPFPVTHASGTDLARGAAAHALAHLPELREEEMEEMVTAIMPTHISVLTANGGVAPIVGRYQYLPAGGPVLFTTAHDNQTRVVVDLVVGNRARPADNCLFARVALDGLKPVPKGEARIRVSVVVSYDEGTRIVVEQVLDGEPSVVKTILQIPDPFVGKTSEELNKYTEDVKDDDKSIKELPDY